MASQEVDCPDCGGTEIKKADGIRWECVVCGFWWNVYEDDEDE